MLNIFTEKSAAVCTKLRSTLLVIIITRQCKSVCWVCRPYPSEGVWFKVIGEEVGDVLPQELHHGLLLLTHQIQPGPGAFDRVLAASDSGSKSSNQIKKKQATTWTKCDPFKSRMQQVEQTTVSRVPKDRFPDNRRASKGGRTHVSNSDTDQESGLVVSSQTRGGKVGETEKQPLN